MILEPSALNLRLSIETRRLPGVEFDRIDKPNGNVRGRRHRDVEEAARTYTAATDMLSIDNELSVIDTTRDAKVYVDVSRLQGADRHLDLVGEWIHTVDLHPRFL